MTTEPSPGDRFLEQYRDRASLVDPGGALWFSVEVATEIIDNLTDADLAAGRIEGAIIKADGEYHPVDLIREAEPEHLYQTWAEYKIAINAGARAFVTGYLRAAGELVAAYFILDTVEDWRRERRRLFGKAAPDL